MSKALAKALLNENLILIEIGDNKKSLFGLKYDKCYYLLHCARTGAGDMAKSDEPLFGNSEFVKIN